MAGESDRQMQYSRVPEDTFEHIQVNAGIIAREFVPGTGEYDGILGATSGGFTFNSNPTYEDFGADIDNVRANTWQLKRIKGYDPAASGSFRTVTAALARELNGAGAYGMDGQTEDATHIVPGHQLEPGDFRDIWIIGDYSSANTGAGAGFVAIHLMKALNTTGFKWKTNRDGKGEFDFEYHGHYDIGSPETAPFEIYVRGGESGEGNA